MTDEGKNPKCSRCGKVVECVITFSSPQADGGRETPPICNACLRKVTAELKRQIRRPK